MFKSPYLHLFCPAFYSLRPCFFKNNTLSLWKLQAWRLYETCLCHTTVSACPAHGCGGDTDELCALHHARPARSLLPIPLPLRLLRQQSFKQRGLGQRRRQTINNNNMRLFGIILRIVELILLISISVLVVCVLWTCEDKATLTDCLSESAVGLFWLFPITIPIAACLLVSLFVSLIKSVKTKNVYNKFIFGIHLFNIFVIPLTFLFLPSSGEPPTAQAMADNYYKHAEDMKCLVELIEDYVGNDGGIDYTNVNGKILALSIKSGGKWIHQKEINAQWQKGKTVAGISRHKLDVLDAYMHAANVQGINSCDRRSISLLFRRYGYTKSVYEIYRSKDIAITDSYRQSNSYILFNDTIAFVYYGVYPGNSGFPDYKQFTDQMRQQKRLNCDKY